MVKIIFIDDEKTTLSLLTEIIDWGSIGFIVSGTARDGLAGLRLCQGAAPHIVIVDINMPIMDGFTFIRELRKTDHTTKVIILSAYDESEHAWTLGISGYLLKPLDEHRLIRLLMDLKEEIKSNAEEKWR